MNRIAALMLSITVLLLAAPAVQATDEVALRAHLRSLADGWDQAIVAKDREAIAANMAEDFRQIRGSGQVVDKATFVTDITADALRIDPYQVEEFEIRLYGEAALISGRVNMSGEHAGERIESHFRFIDVYAQRDGEWKIVSVQITPLKP